MTLLTRLKAAQPILIAILLAIFLRAWAVSLLPQDFDEPVYLQNGFDYANLIRAGDVNAVIDYPQTIEHPDLGKLVYAAGVLVLGKLATWTNAFYLARALSAIFGVLAVAFLAIAIDPFAAGMLAVHTLAVKYTSQVYLEAIPSAMSLAAIMCFLSVKREGISRWFWLSAIALGISTASKYSYTPVTILVLAYLAIFEKKIPWHWLLVFSVTAAGVFLFLDVHLWHDPISRLLQSITFHVQYSQGSHVQEVGYPWYQPFIWIFTSPPAGWHPNVFFYYGFDGLISIFAVVGIPREWKQRRWLVIWFASGLLFLLAWPTKWPQYALILTPALCLMGAATLHQFWSWLKSQESYWDYFRNLLPPPSRWFWGTVALFAFFIAAVYLSAAVKLAVGKIGWSHMTAQNSFLPSNTINALLPLQNGEMVIATDKGAIIYTLPRTTEENGKWVLFNTENSDLSDDRVLSLAHDSLGNLWFGTAAGLDRYDGQKWKVFHSSDMGLSNDQVNSIEVVKSGEVIAGTQEGASIWNGSKWTPISGIDGNQPVFTIAASESDVWLGSQKGAWQITYPTDETTFYKTTSAVKDLQITEDGVVWAATLGSGLAKMENGSWKYFTTANSGLPLNLVNWVEEVQLGKIWVATSLAGDVGGEVAAYDGSNWSVFSTENSGSSGAEPRVIVQSSNQQVWIGTASQGIDIYRLQR